MEQVLSIYGTWVSARRQGTVLLLALFLAAAPLPAAGALALPGSVTQLAEVLGAVHHLRALCGTNEGPLWRNKMIEMMSIGNPSQTERQQLIKHFNDAYYRYRNAYSACTATAAAQADKLMREGQRLSSDLAASGYGR